MTVDAVDFSNWQSVPTPSVIQCWKDQGVRRAIIAFYPHDEALARRQIEACQAGGLEVEIYVWVKFRGPVGYYVRAAKPVVDQYGLKRVWVDAEDGDAAGFTHVTILNRLQIELDLVTSYLRVNRGLYTGAWWWRPYTGDSTRFKEEPLWYAAYNEWGDAWERESFGGWERDTLAMKQYRGSKELCGFTIDYNIILEEDDMGYTKEETDAKVGALFSAIVDQGKTIHAVASAVWEHIGSTTTTPADASTVLKELDRLKAEYLAFVERVEAAAKVLNP